MNLTALLSPSTLVAIDRNRWSQWIGMSGRDRRNTQARAQSRLAELLLDDLSGGFALNICRQLRPAILAPRSRYIIVVRYR